MTTKNPKILWLKTHGIPVALTVPITLHLMAGFMGGFTASTISQIMSLLSVALIFELYQYWKNMATKYQESSIKWTNEAAVWQNAYETCHEHQNHIARGNK